MADNVTITQGSGTTIAADEVTRNAVSEKQQIVKISLGAEGAFDNLVDSGQQASSASFPVVQSANEAVLQVGTVAAASLTTSFQALITPAAAAKALEFENRTDKIVVIGFNTGAADHKILDPGAVWAVNLQVIGMKETSRIDVKLQSAGAASGDGVRCLALTD